MPQSPAPKTNKTEFMRYLNDYGVLVPMLRVRRREYSAIPNSMTVKLNTFGMWVRTKYRSEFDVAYIRFWLRKPHLYGKVYEEMTLQ